jgi:phosphoribosylaminoimidazole-succinocarboxamide synthase
MTTPVVTTIDLPGIPRVRSGKVREVFDAGENYLIVATDRISAFDCILPGGIPGKGSILNQLSAWWFERLAHVIPNHLVSIDVEEFPPALQAHREVLRGRSMLVRKTKVFPVECVARGHLAGSGWKEYQSSGTVCGIALPPGLRLADRLPEPIFTPATKAESGHDENISHTVMAGIVGGDIADALRDTTLALYREAADFAAGRGLILADTKFEFGRAEDGRILLIDEALTPDSSRYWPAGDVVPGTNPPSFDKQFVRDYLASLDWDKSPPAPALPDEVARQTAAKYREAFALLTGHAFPGD